MPRYCPIDKKVLTRNISSGFPVFTCTCGARYDGDDDDSLIASSFVEGNVDIPTVLKFADKASAVNAQADVTCPVCGRIYMTLVAPEPLFFYKCGRCQTILNGDESIYVKGEIPKK